VIREVQKFFGILIFMKSKAKVVIVGGGVVGVSTLYHLAKKGWSDVVLVERKELTSGSTWHAAGLLPLFNMSYSVGQLHKYAVDFYKTLEEETGQNVGFSVVSNIRLATTQDRMDEYYQYAGVAKTIGVEVKFLTPEQVKDIWPLCNTDGLIGAIQHPEDGYIQPADLTQALAKGARDKGAEIYRNTNVVGIKQNNDETWTVETDKGEIACEHIVSCSGNFARQTGKMVGLDLPVIPVEHQYIVTEPHPEIQKRKEQGLPEMGVLRDSDSSWYMREEAGGLILGPYEKDAPACYVDGPSKDSEFELFQEDLDRLESHIESAIQRVPIFGEVGVKKVYNGAICYTPDGSPIVGPAWGLKNFWINEGHSFGITAAGGAGWQLGEWMVDGEPTIDMMGVDPRRFGDYVTKSFLIQKNEEAYANVFTIHYPDEEREAGRPLRQAPCYDRLKDLGAVFGQKFGWERANWFAPKGVEQIDDWSFRRSKWFEHVGNECKNVQENVGLLDMTAFAKCRISGPGAERLLDNLVANKLPKKNGRVNLCHALNKNGGVLSEYTIAKESNDSYYIVSAGAFQRLDHDWIQQWMPKDRSVKFENLTNSIGVLVLAGPKARDLMSKVSSADFSNENFPWLSSQKIDVGLAPTIAMRMNFVGELGWELHHSIEYQNHIFDRLMEVGKEFKLKPFGIRAMDSLRIEKTYKLIGTEMSIEYSPFESSLDRFVHLNKGNFIGRDALVQWQQKEIGRASCRERVWLKV
jgi:dimethylglycine dehydrogenase